MPIKIIELSKCGTSDDWHLTDKVRSGMAFVARDRADDEKVLPKVVCSL